MDPTAVKSAVTAALQKDPDARRHPDARARRRRSVAGRPRGRPTRSARSCSGTFDLSPNVLQAVAQGKMLFAIDQQQFMQGYLPVEFLALNKRDGLMPKGIVMTGPELRHQAERRAGDRARASRASAERPGRRPGSPAPSAPHDRRCRHGHHDRPGPRRAPAADPARQAADGAPRAGRRRRRDHRLPLLRHRRRRQRHVHAARHRHLPRRLGPARHHRRRGRAPDDRRRVRPLARLDDRLRRHRPRDPRRPVGLADLALHPGGLRRRGRGRHRQRGDRQPHRPAVVHRHAGRPLHPARPDHWLHPRDHRPHPGLGPEAARPSTTGSHPCSTARSAGRCSPGWRRNGWIDRHTPTARRSSRACRPRSSGGSSSPLIATWVLLRTRVGNWIFASRRRRQRGAQRRRAGGER